MSEATTGGNLSREDVFLLLGHASILRMCRGEVEIPYALAHLAERVAITIGDASLAADVRIVVDGWKRS